MKKLSLILILLFYVFSSIAATNITTPTVSGHWTIAGSPYKIFNDITVNTGDSLVIDPGVEVVFQGGYKLSIRGLFKAVGSSANKIIFHAQDTTSWCNDSVAYGGWRGIELVYLAPHVFDSTKLKYCVITDIKNGALSIQRQLDVVGCDIYHNRYSLPAANHMISFQNVWHDTGFHSSLDSCSIYENYIMSIGRIIIGSSGLFEIKNCSIHSNWAVSILSFGFGQLSVVNSDVYDNMYVGSFSAVGTIYIESSNVNISNNRIYANKTGICAPLYLVKSKATIDNNLICNNIATATTAFCGMNDGGGGIRVSDPPDSTPRGNYIIRNNVIANNQAVTWGGAINVYMTNALIANNTIVNNSVYAYGLGSGIEIFNNPIVCGHTAAKIVNNIFKGNHTPWPYGIYDSSNSIYLYYADTFLCEHNYLPHPYYREVINGFPSPITYLLGDTTTNIVATSPLFIAPTLTHSFTESALSANFKLLPSSPCINAGDTSRAMRLVGDYEGSFRLLGSNIDMGAYEDASVTISLHAVADTICPGTLATCICSVASAVGTINYVWIVNGITITGATNASYSFIPGYGDVVQCNVSTTSLSGTIVNITSNPLSFVLLPPAIAPAISIVATPAASVCLGTLVTLTASISGGGSIPLYTWIVNGMVAGTGTSYSYTPANTDSILCTLTSNEVCASLTPVLSNVITIVVVPIAEPVISISGPMVTPVASTVALTATITGGGSSYTIYWYKNGAVFDVGTVAYTTYTKTPGKDTISAFIFPSDHCIDSATSAEIHVSDDNSGVERSTSNDLMTLYPNPAFNTLFIELFEPKGYLKVMDIYGSVIVSKKITDAKTTIDLANFSAGLYLIKWEDEGKVNAVKKIVVR